MVIVMMWLVLYDINYIYRRKTPRFVDYDEVEAGKIKQSFTFLLKDIYGKITPPIYQYKIVTCAVTCVTGGHL